MTPIEASVRLQKLLGAIEDPDTAEAIRVVVRYVRTCPDVDAMIEAARAVGGDPFLIEVVEHLGRAVITLRADVAAWEEAHAKERAAHENADADAAETIARLRAELDAAMLTVQGFIGAHDPELRKRKP